MARRSLSPNFGFCTIQIRISSQQSALYYGPEDKQDIVRGTDVIIVEGGKVKALWTSIDNAPGKL